MNNYFISSIEKIKQLVKIKSVKQAPIENKPFGEGVYEALNETLKIAKDLGFETKNYNNYIGEIIFGEGSDEDGFAILCHLDVVPEGDESKWEYSPYLGEEKGGYLYGRGVVDDKAPAILCLYALKELKDSGFIPSRKIKLILGCDEESGWKCIEHYNNVAVMPNEGFSPDGDFPVIYAEKGIYHVEFSFGIDKRVTNLFGGERVNMVCDYCEAKIEKIKETEKEFFIKNGLTVENDIIKSYGKSAHGSTPQVGINAIKKLLYSLTKLGFFDDKDYKNLFENNHLFDSIVDETGKLTFSPDVALVKDGKLKIQVDIRYPSTFNLEEIEKIIKNIGEFKVLHHQKPIMVDKNSKLVKTLLNIYNEENKTNKQAIAIGGGTYARALKNGVAFGPMEIDQNECHVPNEKMKISDMEKCYNIYKKAIKELTK